MLFQKTSEVQNKDTYHIIRQNKFNIGEESETKVNKFRKEDRAGSEVQKTDPLSPLKMGPTFSSEPSRNQYKEKITLKLVIHSAQKAKANQLPRRSVFILVLRPEKNLSYGSS